MLVYTVWACLKGVTPNKTLKEEPTNKNHYDGNYSAPFACRSFAFDFWNAPLLPGMWSKCKTMSNNRHKKYLRKTPYPEVVVPANVYFCCFHVTTIIVAMLSISNVIIKPIDPAPKKKKSIFYNNRLMLMCKIFQIYIFGVKKKTCFWVV